MLVLIVTLPFLVALACLSLNQTVPTRRLGIAAAATLLGYGLALLAARWRGGLPLDLAAITWMVVETKPLVLVLRFDALSWALALTALLGGGLALLILALGLPIGLRGFGGLFAAALLAIFVSVAGLANFSAALLPFAWGMVALLTFLALRSSGALAGSEAPVIVLLAGLCSALVLLGAVLLGPALPGTPVVVAALICWALLSLLVFGAPPFHAALQQLAEAPAPLAGALLTLGLPLLGGSALIRFMAGQGAGVPAGWRLAFTLLGLLTLFAGAAGALGSTHMRRWLAWQFSGQMGAVFVAAGQGGGALSLAAPALLINGVVSTLVCFLAVALLERRTGTDDLTAMALDAPLIGPGALLLVGAASAVGLPGVWGFWAHSWLLNDMVTRAPWVVAPLLAGSTLLALAFLPPLTVFWRRDATARPAGAPAPESRLPLVLGWLAALPLLILGIVPQLAWNGWLAQLQPLLGASATPPWLPATLGLVASASAALVLVGTPLLVQARAPRGTGSQAPVAGALAPQGLGESMRLLTQLGLSQAAFEAGWNALLRTSDLLRRGLALLEQRYYLAGLLIAVIVVILLFVQ